MTVPPRIRSPLVVCALMVILLGCGCTIVVIVFGPKHVPLSLNPKIFTGYYWGDDRFLGRHFYRVVANEGECGYWEVEIRGAGWNRYRGYYPDGTLREEGEIDVTYGGFPPEPQPDNSKVKWGNYYRPDGTLNAQVRDGTGEQVLWYPNGNLHWKQVLKDYKRVSYEFWTKDGKLISRGKEKGTGPGEW